MTFFAIGTGICCLHMLIVVSNSCDMVEMTWVFIISSVMVSWDPMDYFQKSICLAKYYVILSFFDSCRAWALRTIWSRPTWFVILTDLPRSVSNNSTGSSMASIHGSRSSMQLRWIRTMTLLAFWCHSFCGVHPANPLWLTWIIPICFTCRSFDLTLENIVETIYSYLMSAYSECLNFYYGSCACLCIISDSRDWIVQYISEKNVTVEIIVETMKINRTNVKESSAVN